MTALLASVRSPAEARIVAAAGAHWIDLKEPAAGALGAVDHATVAAVAHAHGATHRISATIGDCWGTPAVIPSRIAAMTAAGAQYVKVGAYAAAPEPALLAALTAACASPARVIVVCFAERVPRNPDLQRLAATGIAGLMLDTAVKDGPSLTGLLTARDLADFVNEVRRLGLLSGLAGRLCAEDIASLLHIGPDYLGFRGALCGGGARTAEIDPRRVRALIGRFTHTSAVQQEEGTYGLA